MSPSVLFVTTVPVTLEAFLVPFADHFRSKGWRVDALANGATNDPHIEGAFDQRFNVSWSRNPLDPRNLLGSASRVRRVVEQGAYDIVNVHTPIASFVTRYGLRNRSTDGPLVIYTAHGFHFHKGQSPPPHALFRTMERIAAPWTDYLVTINEEDFAAARALGRIDPRRVRLIPGIGVDTERFSPDAVTGEEARALRARLDIDSGAFMLTMVAEFAPVKRHRLALEALALVHNRDVVLLLVGDGPLLDEVRDSPAARRLGDRVRFAGYRRDIPVVLAASDAFLLCSKREGLNRSVLEAMASGKPVVGTDTRGITDAVGSTAGWIAAKNDASELALAIDAASADPEELARRGAAARKRAVTEFALPHVLKAYEELYHEALSSRV